MKSNLSVRFAGVFMENPVMNAAGTFEAEQDCISLYRAKEIGAVVTKTIRLNKIDGNPQPRIMEVPGGLINCIGLQGPGVKVFVKDKLPEFNRIGVPVIVNFGGKSIEEYLKTAKILQLKAEHLIAALETNVSCPNVKDGMIFGCDPKLLLKLVKAIKKEISLSLIVKLTPNVTDIGLIARAAQDGGADAISAVNTFKARDFIPPGLDGDRWIEGGLSGPCIKPLALQKVWEVSRAVDLPIIAMGGISNTQDALTFLKIKNVKAIAVGTNSFNNPLTMVQIIDGLGKYFEEKGYANLEEFKQKEQI
jgi:dihydroorotate dehydrogenase (NAD+) catalytic subunit